MQYDSRISEYLVQFNTLAFRVHWGDAALRFQFYDGLPERLKEKVVILRKPESLREMVNITVHYDTLYWERQTKRRLTRRFDPKPTLSRPSKPLRTLTNTLPPTNRNSVSTLHQPEAPRSTPCTPKPYDNVLGLDGKLKPEELECRRKGRLCLVCGSGNHHASECPTSKWGHATKLQVAEDSEVTPREEIESEKSENY